MLSLSFVLPTIGSNLPLTRLCNCSEIGASGSRAVLGSVVGWLGTLGATISVGDGPGALLGAFVSDPAVFTFDAGLSASTLAAVESARAARAVNSSKTRGVKAISPSRRRRGIADPPLGRAIDSGFRATVVHLQPNSPAG